MAQIEDALGKIDFRFRQLPHSCLSPDNLYNIIDDTV